ncbi:hypothetical protein [Maridesulfovibrio sp.]|uniref:hypothetical protein n=1 Tax=Maridesulfovibrio sp. TaxID=2795000 RepID=UPI002AA79E6B|nr:hypothetical protein [Maridesulfovibrio sp.]
MINEGMSFHKEHRTRQKRRDDEITRVESARYRLQGRLSGKPGMDQVGATEGIERLSELIETKWEMLQEIYLIKVAGYHHK